MAKDAPIKKNGLFGWYFNFNLLYRILIGLVLGAIVGIVLAASGITQIPGWLQMLGDIFVRLLKMILVPIVFSTLVVGSASVSPANLGKVGLRVVGIYLVTSAIAVAIGLLMGVIFRPNAQIAATMAAEAAGKTADVSVWNTLSGIIPKNIFSALTSGAILQIIFFAIIFGISLSYLKVSDDERLNRVGNVMFDFFDGFAEIMMKMVKGIMEYAPIGVFALICGVFAKQGASVAGSLAIVTIACFLGYILHILLVYTSILRMGKIKLSTFWKSARNPFVTAFVTRSSSGTLPVTIEAAKELGVKKEVYSFSLPLGATINMDGTAIYQGVCSIFIALSVGHGLFGASDLALIVLTATLASIGTAGVPGAGAIMLAMVMQQVRMPIEPGTAIAGAYALILGIDAILDMGRTALNVFGDLTCTTFVAKKLGMLEEDSIVK
ncbi:MAG: dicarboxylate/amino acid:cation symporter [Sphaerochaetaceae bacterium]|nr:dicarboxylate/amino acid:cation symporter [Sphaerochaetaceae bacterium]